MVYHCLYGKSSQACSRSNESHECLAFAGLRLAAAGLGSNVCVINEGDGVSPKVVLGGLLRWFKKKAPQCGAFLDCSEQPKPGQLLLLLQLVYLPVQ